MREPLEAETPANAAKVIVLDEILSVHPTLLEGRERDALSLDWHQRRFSRKKHRTARGREVALALPTGTELRAGVVLHVAPDWYLQVEAAEEEVIVARPRTEQERLILAYEVGNRHFPLALRDEDFLLLPDPAMEQLLGRLGVPWRRARHVFQPLKPEAPHEH